MMIRSDLRQYLIGNQKRLPPVRQPKTVVEGATHVVASSTPGLRWEVTKEDGGYTIRVMHVKSGKLLWTLNTDRIPKEKLDTSLKAMDRIWSDSGVNWDVEADELSSQKNLGSVVSGITRSLDQRKKPITHNDPNEPILGKLVYFESKEPQMDKKSILERMDESRVGKPRVAKGLQEAPPTQTLQEASDSGDYKPGCGSCGCQTGLKHGQCKDCRAVASVDEQDFSEPTDLTAEGVCLEAIERQKGRFDRYRRMSNGSQYAYKHGQVMKDPNKDSEMAWIGIWQDGIGGFFDKKEATAALKQFKTWKSWDRSESGIQDSYTKPKEPPEPPVKDSDDLHTADAVNTDPENPDAEGQKADPAYKKQQNEDERIIKRDPDGKFGSGPNAGMPKPKGRNSTNRAGQARLTQKISRIGKQQGLPEDHNPEEYDIDPKDQKEYDESGLSPREYYAQKGKTHPAEKGKKKDDDWKAKDWSTPGKLKKVPLAKAKKKEYWSMPPKKKIKADERTTPAQNTYLYEAMGSQRKDDTDVK